MAKPVRARIYYKIEEKIVERGDYIINDEQIPGYRNYYYNSAIWLTWKLPRSTMSLISSIRKWTWTHPGIKYDQSKMDLDKRRQDHFMDFTIEDKRIKKYDKFLGQESTIHTQIQNTSGPSEIYVFFDNGKEIRIKANGREKVLAKLQQLLN
jgi:hypothetical protein